MIDEDKKYEDVIGALKNLQQVKAPPNFESDLKRRLNAEKYESAGEKNKRSFWVPSRLVPTFGLAVAAIVVIFLVDLNSEESDNPFLIEPKVREDMIAVTSEQVNEVPMKQLPETKEEPKLEEKSFSDKKRNDLQMEERSAGNSGGNLMSDGNFTLPESTTTKEMEITSKDELSTELATGIAVRKSGLNFRQINQTLQEKKEILELKKKIQTPVKMKSDK